MRVAFFTAGSKGAGHLVRGLALQRALLKRDPSTTFRLFSPPSDFARIAGDAFSPLTIEPQLLRSPATAASSSVAQALLAFRPDVVVIDLFWVPLVFVPLPCPAWLLLRSVPPAWLRGPVEAPFDAGAYDRVFSLEDAPGLAAVEGIEALDPVVVVDADDVAVDSPWRGQRVVVQAGLKEDRAALDAAAARLGGDFVHLDLHDATAPFPVAPWLATADVVVAAPGYNTFYEAHVLGFSSRTTWVPIGRTFDDGAWRASQDLRRKPRNNGAHALAAALLQGG